MPVSVKYFDNVGGMTAVELFVNGQKVVRSSQAPFALSLDTTALSDGNHTLTAKAFDEVGNTGVSTTVTITVNNTPEEPVADTIAPVITHFSLTDGMRIGRRQMVTISTRDNQKVAQITLVIDGRQVASSNTNTLSYNWKTRGSKRNTACTVKAVARDQAGMLSSKQ